jgi:hypothetical protein
MRNRFFIALVSAGAAMFLLVPAVAQAGAFKYDWHYCSEDGTFCQDGTTLFNPHVTPSGVLINPYHSDYTATFSDNGCSGQQQGRENTTYALQPDGGAYHVASNQTLSQSCEDGTTMTCFTTQTFTLADNAVREFISHVKCERQVPATSATSDASA